MNDLIKAVSDNDIVRVGSLLQQGVDVNFKDRFGGTALMYAARNSHIEIVSKLLSVPGIDVNVKDSYGKTALMYAARNSHIEIADKLLAFPNIDVNVKFRGDDTALVIASGNGHIEMVDKLLSVPGIDVNAKGWFGNTALMIAAEKGHIEVVDKLLEFPGIDVNIQDKFGRTVLIAAVEEGCIDIVDKLLLVPGIDVIDKDMIPRVLFHCASSGGHVDRLETLLSSFPCIDVNVKGRSGRTALTYAARKGHIEIVDKLLSVPKIDVNVKDMGGKTVLMYAAVNGYIKILDKLLAVPGIDVNAKNESGQTALICSAARGRIEVLDKLIAVPGIDMNAQDKLGRKYYDYVTKKVAKYLTYTGSVLLNNNSLLDASSSINKIEEICFNNDDDRNNYSFYRCLEELHRMLSILIKVVACDAIKAFPYRIGFLEARLCGVSFAEDITVRHTGMPMQRFVSVSSLMRSAVLAKLLCGYNSYISILMIMRESVSSALLKLPFDMKVHLISFMAVGDIARDLRASSQEFTSLIASSSSIRSDEDIMPPRFKLKSHR